MQGYIINTDSEAIEKHEKIQEEEANLAKKFEFNEKNYLNTRLKENETERRIRVRILPVSATNGDIFLPIYFHSLMVDKEISRSGFKTYICLNDLNVQDHDSRGCPLCNHSKELFNEANNMTNKSEQKTMLKSAYSFQRKRVYIVRVIERGKEDEGVKFWRFNERSDKNGIYDKLMELYKQRKEEAKFDGEENYSIFDLNNGRDIIITLKYIANTKKTTIDIVDSGNKTPLSKDIDLANKWISDTKTWRDIYAIKDYDYLSIISEGKIPYLDKINNKWIEKKPQNINKDKEQEVLDTEDVPFVQGDNGDDLPF